MVILIIYYFKFIKELYFNVYFFIFVDNGEFLSQILAERCDGNRNLLHACVSVCAPISNKELEGNKL